MNFEIKEVLALGMPPVSLLANLWMWFMLRRIEQRKADEGQIEGIKDAISAHANRLVALETGVSAGVSRADIQELHSRVTAQTEELHELTGSFNAANHTLKLIVEHMLKGATR